jgi:hypothetical protein
MTYWSNEWNCHPRDEQLLDDARFWVRILKEHAMFIQLGLPADEPELIQEAQSFVDRFQMLQNALDTVDVIEPELLQELQQAVMEIIDFKRRILRRLVQCQLGGNLFPLLIDHITREAVRFLNLLMANGQHPMASFQLLAEEESFWLRIMKEHLEFVSHLLDPSERTLIKEAEDLETEVAQLQETARDLASMSQSGPETFPSLTRFTEEVLLTVIKVRDFKADAYEMLLLCQILSIIPSPLLLDHVRREADKALEEIGKLLDHVSM